MVAGGLLNYNVQIFVLPHCFCGCKLERSKSPQLAMASSTAAIAVPSSAVLIDGKSGRPQVAVPAQYLPSPTPSLIRLQRWKSMASGGRMSSNMVVMATGEPPAEAETDISSITKPIQEAWDKIEDKYAVASLALAGLIAIWGSSGLISAIDRLPVVPDVLELVGIGYTGWFIYRNLIFKRDREGLFIRPRAAEGSN